MNYEIAQLFPIVFSVQVFGGGKQMLDSNVQKVCRAGFSPEVAEWALRNNKNDPSKAIRELKAVRKDFLVYLHMLISCFFFFFCFLSFSLY